jgi:hypothetical protein
MNKNTFKPLLVKDCMGRVFLNFETYFGVVLPVVKTFLLVNERPINTNIPKTQSCATFFL